MGFNALLGMLGTTLIMFMAVGFVGYILFHDPEA